MDPRLLRFGVKGCLFSLGLLLLVLPGAVGIHRFQRLHEPRRALLHGADAGPYAVALLGDSAFCSFYVDREEDTLWNQLGELAGTPCFPGALNGAKGGDFIDAAHHLARTLRPGAVVFIDIVPTRLMWNEGNRGRNHDLAAVLKPRDSILHDAFAYLAVDYLQYALLGLRRDRLAADRQGGYNRVWNRDGDFARVRYEMMLAWSCWSDPETVKRKALANIGYLGELERIFRDRQIRAVFVLTPLNKQQIRTYSSGEVAARVCLLLDDLRELTKTYLRGIGVPCIDLFDACPADGFADVLHTNARGDAVIAASLAAYLRALPAQGSD